MWKIVYNLLLHGALPFFLAIGLFKTKIRRNLLERLLPATGSQGGPPALWIHAASVGEAMIAESLIAYLSTHSRISRFCVTTNTYYTQELLSKRLKGRSTEVLALPLDLPFSLRRFMKQRSFAALLVVETEIWPNLFWMARGRGIPVLIINGRISDRTVKGYRRLSFFLRHVVPSVHTVLAQSADHAARFVSIGFPPEKVVTTGNMKYYRHIESISHQSSSNMAVTFGSIREKEFDILLPVIKRLRDDFPDLTIYVAPREMNLVDRLMERLGEITAVAPYSSAKPRGEPGEPVFVVDRVGELLRLYGLSRVAFVGGSLAPYGGQNILEPLFFGTPVLFGPSYENFAEIGQEIVREGAGRIVGTGDELYRAIHHLLSDPQSRDDMGMKGFRIIKKQTAVMALVSDAILGAVAGAFAPKPTTKEL